MSTNGDQPASHKQQQSATPAQSQSPAQSPEHIHPPAFVQLAPHPGPYALPPGAFSPVFFGHPNPEGMVNHGDPNVPQYLPYTQMMYVYPPMPGQGNKSDIFCSVLDPNRLHSTSIRPPRSSSARCHGQAQTQASQNGCTCPVPTLCILSH